MYKYDDEGDDNDSCYYCIIYIKLIDGVVTANATTQLL